MNSRVLVVLAFAGAAMLAATAGRRERDERIDDAAAQELDAAPLVRVVLARGLVDVETADVNTIRVTGGAFRRTAETLEVRAARGSLRVRVPFGTAVNVELGRGLARIRGVQRAKVRVGRGAVRLQPAADRGLERFEVDLARGAVTVELLPGVARAALPLRVAIGRGQLDYRHVRPQAVG